MTLFCGSRSGIQNFSIVVGSRGPMPASTTPLLPKVPNTRSQRIAAHPKLVLLGRVVTDVPCIGGQQPADASRIQTQVAMDDADLSGGQQQRTVGRSAHSEEQIDQQRRQHDPEEFDRMIRAGVDGVEFLEGMVSAVSG
jgi:hypothetical protein